MKASMYFNYTSRSLMRGGQRTVLAIFCVTVGVMAIVALQLVGYMLQNSLTTSTRDSLGGDIVMTAQNSQLSESDLAWFANLKKQGTITGYTVLINNNGTLTAAASSFQSFTVAAVDPANYPIVTPPTFNSPGNANISNLLTNNQVVVTQSFLDKHPHQLGDTFDLYLKTRTGSGQTLHVKLAGVVSNTGVFAQSGSLVLISQQDFLTTTPGTTAAYTIIEVTTANQTQTDVANASMKQQFPLASTQTAAEALQTQQSTIDSVTKFLEIAGLLALLIGGVGIVNTMQVLLSRRKTEIAMLKTAGYRRFDLYLLFGLEAGMLGLIGGVIGAGAATGVSYIVRVLMQNLGLTVPFTLNLGTIAGGVAIGLVTSLIFGLLPIVQAANVRPLNVVRDQPESKGLSSLALTVGLLGVLSVLFCALAVVILNGDFMLGVIAVYGTFAFLIFLSLFFSLLVLGLSKLPVPEHFSLKQLGLVLVSATVSALVWLVLPAFGILLMAASLLGIMIVWLPRSWKVSIKLALRNLGRQRTRTTTTAVALFIGVFSVGLVLGLGQDLQSQISNSFSQSLNYNLVTVTSATDTTTLQAQLGTVPGLSKNQQNSLTQAQPSAVNLQPLSQTLPTGDDRQKVINFLSTIEGYDLSLNPPSSKIVRGRSLNASDAGTNNIMISELLTDTGPFQMHLKVGDTITFTKNGSLITTTIVGIYARSSNADHIGSVLASSTVVKAFSPATAGGTTVTYMKIETSQVNQALDTLGKIVPNATVQNMADIAAYIQQLLGNILNMLVAIASLSVIAGVIIVANTVALAMLERKRELGILKAVGYTSSTVLREVVIENGLVGAVGALLAMLLVSGALGLIGNLAFNLSFSLSPLIVFSLIGGSALLAMLTAAFVAWGAVRIRPQEVLRYE